MLDIAGVQGHLDYQLLEQGQLYTATGTGGLCRHARLILVEGPRHRRLGAATVRFTVEEKRALQPIAGNENLDSVLSDEEDVTILVTYAAFEENVRIEVDRGAACILGHPVAIVDVLGNLLRGLFVHEVRIGGVGTDGDCQQAVNDNVGVASDR